MPETRGPVLALLRGINVGGRSMLSMSELRAALDAAGLPGARTHLQSGNLLVTPAAGKVRGLAGTIRDVIKGDFGLDIQVLLRTRPELDEIVARNPMTGPEATGSKVHVVFLASTPEAKRVDDLDPDRSPPDRFVVAEREIYVHYPNGSGRSKLSLDYFEKRLGVVGTARNWNTVTRLLEMLDESPE
ncbi:MAG TPA: DUF1697 domain-containing protein [Acidimicrobiia bacterium]|nr:DUF1697 domain-containing protein [Acidimicrobiia bacterium]